MTLFDRFIRALQRIFGSHLTKLDKDPTSLAQAVIQKQKQSQKRLKHSLTELIFQRKKFETQLLKLENNKFNIKEDINTAALEDRDDLALRLMGEMDLIVSEIAETQKNLQIIKSEIQTAKRVETELNHQIEKSESQLAILVSRNQSVRLREEMQSHFSQMKKEISGIQPGLTGIEESILHLEARLESIQGPEESWKAEVLKMRKDRTNHFKKSRLEQLKIQLRSHQLPGREIVPEIVNQNH